MATSQAQARTASSSSSSAKGGGKTRTSARLIERDDGSAGEGTAVNGYQHAGEGVKEQLERSKKRKAGESLFVALHYCFHGGEDLVKMGWNLFLHGAQLLKLTNVPCLLRL